MARRKSQTPARKREPAEAPRRAPAWQAAPGRSTDGRRRRGEDTRRRLFEAMLTLMGENSDIPTIGAIAARHHLSDRSIRTLFSQENTTFSDFVLEQRLALVHRRLSDRAFSAYTISTIAVESGFGDVSYFNNAFRRHYGCTPSEVRAMGLEPLGSSRGAR